MSNLFEEAGKKLRPKVVAIINLKNKGGGIPDGGLFTKDQLPRKADPNFAPPLPARGAIEVKGTKDNVFKIAKTAQVEKYLDMYGTVLITNLRDFALVGRDQSKNLKIIESYTLADNESDFWQKASSPKAVIEEHGASFEDFLLRVMLFNAPLRTPQAVAEFLANYAREAKARIDIQPVASLDQLRQAFEQALGLTFEGDKGDRFFRSTLIQTLFYGVFSAWVLWHNENPDRIDYFHWQLSPNYLHVPMIQALFEEMSKLSNIGKNALNIQEVLDRAGLALNRVERGQFFLNFDAGLAIQYFYEPFLNAFSPQLRKDLGVWYTPVEIVNYMVERVDQVLRDELKIADGLADDNVYILDPACGTGAYLLAVLDRIKRTKEADGDALAMAKVKDAALNRVFGFEILTAPFVIAHLQIGLFLQQLNTPVVGQERAAVYLTNALTGWEPPTEQAKQTLLKIPALQAEKDAAEHVKRDVPVIVVLGNPPYNAFAGTSPDEEHGLVDVYKEGLIDQWGIKKFNLDDLYVRFVRLAERRVADMTGKGVVCYITNFSYLSEQSFVVMRELLLNQFDKLWFDNLNGDSRETGKRTPEGLPDPSVFSTPYNRAGIRKGTAVGLFVKSPEANGKTETFYREFWGNEKREELARSINEKVETPKYKKVVPAPKNRYSFRDLQTDEYYFAWPSVTEFSEVSPINGLMEKRGGALFDMDRNALEERMRLYYQANVENAQQSEKEAIKKEETTWKQLVSLNTGLTKNAARFDARKARKKVLAAEKFDASKLQRYAMRPFDTQYCYPSKVRPLWNEPRPSLIDQVWSGNAFLLTRVRSGTVSEGVPFYYTPFLSDDHLITPDASCFSLRLKKMQLNKPANQMALDLGEAEETITANISPKVRQYYQSISVNNPDSDPKEGALIWMHTLAVGYAADYYNGNKDGVRWDWPRIPLPSSKKLLVSSAKLGSEIADLLNPENPLKPGHSFLRIIGLPSHAQGKHIDPNSDLVINVNWGSLQRGSVTMPGQGSLIERPYSKIELQEIEATANKMRITVSELKALLGDSTFDIYLNEVAYWKNIPSNIWGFYIGGYQVIKKWLSYRDEAVINRPITVQEMEEVQIMSRRIGAIILMHPVLNANYAAVKDNAYQWPEQAA